MGLLTVLVFITSATLAFCLGYLLLMRRAQYAERTTLNVREPRPDRVRTRENIEGVLIRLARYAPKPGQEKKQLKQWLVQAGYRSDRAPALFYGISAVAIGLLPGLLGLYLMAAGRSVGHAFLVALMLAIVGFLLPRWALRSQVRARQERLRRALPQALDLITVSVEAGLGVDHSLAKVSEHLRESHPEMAEELALVIAEMRVGSPRADAFRALAARTGLEEIGSFVAVLVQADRFGAPMAHSLRNHAQALRVRRRQRAEEMAAKVQVKLVFPIFFFIFPAIFVVTIAPAFIRIVRELLPIMQR